MGQPVDSKTDSQEEEEQNLTLTSLASENIFEVLETFLLMSSKAFCKKKNKTKQQPPKKKSVVKAAVLGAVMAIGGQSG